MSVQILVIWKYFWHQYTNSNILSSSLFTCFKWGNLLEQKRSYNFFIPFIKFAIIDWATDIAAYIWIWSQTLYNFLQDVLSRIKKKKQNKLYMHTLHQTFKLQYNLTMFMLHWVTLVILITVYCRDLQDQVAMAQGLRWGQGDLEWWAMGACLHIHMQVTIEMKSCTVDSDILT